jgi:hypothetical protein
LLGFLYRENLQPWDPREVLPVAREQWKPMGDADACDEGVRDGDRLAAAGEIAVQAGCHIGSALRDR